MDRRGRPSSEEGNRPLRRFLPKTPFSPLPPGEGAGVWTFPKRSKAVNCILRLEFHTSVRSWYHMRNVSLFAPPSRRGGRADPIKCNATSESARRGGQTTNGRTHLRTSSRMSKRDLISINILRLKARRRELRNSPTVAEATLKRFLKRSGRPYETGVSRTSPAAPISCGSVA